MWSDFYKLLELFPRLALILPRFVEAVEMYCNTSIMHGWAVHLVIQCGYAPNSCLLNLEGLTEVTKEKLLRDDVSILSYFILVFLFALL
jgi:hypothetical protein